MATFYLPSSTGYYRTENTYAVWRINVTEDYSSNGKRLKCELIAWKLSGATEGSSASGYVQWYLDGVASTKTTWGSGGRNIPASGTVTIDTVYITLSDSATSAKITAEFSMNNSVSTNTNGGTVSLSTYTLTFNANGGSWSHGNLTGCYRNTLNIKDAWPTRTGYTFKGWGTTSAATIPSYYGGSKYVITDNATLYAIWEANTYTITYDANGGSSAPAAQSYTYASTGTVTLSSTIPTRTGYTFLGWSTSSTSTSATYSAGGAFSKNVASNTTLYAVWSANTYKVTYDGNGGTSETYGDTWSENATYNSAYVTQKNLYTRPGYTFIGWNENPDGSGTDWTNYIDKEWVWTYTKDVTLYAIWSEHYLHVHYYSNLAETCVYENALNEVGAGKNVLFYSHKYYYDNVYNDGLGNYSTSDSGLYVTRLGYKGTGYYGTEVDGGILVHEDTAFNSGQELAEVFGLSLKDGIKEVNIYVQWEQLNLAYYKIDDNYVLCRTYIKVNDTWQPAIMYRKIDGNYKRSIV